MEVARKLQPSYRKYERMKFERFGLKTQLKEFMQLKERFQLNKYLTK